MYAKFPAHGESIDWFLSNISDLLTGAFFMEVSSRTSLLAIIIQVYSCGCVIMYRDGTLKLKFAICLVKVYEDIIYDDVRVRE